MSHQFPEHFYWGVSDSAHQTEGHNHNDWTAWEQDHAKGLADQAQARLLAQARYTGTMPDWATIKQQATRPYNYISGAACDRYNRYGDDFTLAKELGCSAYRLSIEWSRIEPVEGVFDKKAIEHYQAIINTLRQSNLEPFITLWHWTIPRWLRDKGGWTSKAVIDHFCKYVDVVAQALATNVQFWITINEPLVYASAAYHQGIFPPQHTSWTEYMRVINNLNRAHTKAYAVIKHTNPAALVGIAKSAVHFEACHNRFVNRLIKTRADWWWNYRFMNKIIDSFDFIGINHYHHNLINHTLNQNENERISDLGWELFPESIYHVLNDFSRYQRPLYITEHGLADNTDKYRAWFITETLKHVHRALADGVDVRGYFHWSLTDNFEWDKGFWPRFGLYKIDYATQQRIKRPSADVFKNIAATNQLAV